MENGEFKLKKIREITDEVKQFHPLLNDLLSRLPGVSNVAYTHGQREMGADFVITRIDLTLDREEHIGLIVKCGDIRQNHEDVKRQIVECSVSRKVDGGKKKIYLNEIWVIANGGISENAKDKIYEEFHDKKVKFIWDETLVKLINKHLPEYWEDMDRNIGLYLSSVSRRIQDLNSKFSLLEMASGDFYIEQDVAKINLDSQKKFMVKKQSKPEKLVEVLKKERFVMVEAGMGYGKSRLLRQAAIDLAVNRKFVEHGILPVFINFRDLVEVHNNSLDQLIGNLKTFEKIEAEKYSLLFVIDSVDEVKGDNQDKVEKITSFISQLMPNERMRAAFASRPFDDPIVEQALEKCLTRYSLQPLSMQRLVSFVERVCNKVAITPRLKADLQKSDLFRSLPKTPISAILLGRVLNADVSELPSTLPELYSKYLDLALGRWDIKKGNISEKEYETTLILVRNLAKIMFEADISEIGIGDAKSIVAEYLSKRETGQNIDKLFENIINCSEIISVDEVKNKLFFKHRTFLEYMYSENLFIKHGTGATIDHPFDLYWGAVNYFYLGKLKDCPEQLKSIFNVLPQSERDQISKLLQAGQYLLAAYQSPYESIVECVKTIILEASEMYCKICEEPKNSRLGKFSEVQLLAIITGLMRHAFEYEFFNRALRDVETELLSYVGSNKRSAVAAFFIAAIRAGLGNKDAFEALIADHLRHLPLAIQVGIGHASEDAEVTNDTIRRLEKKNDKAKKGKPQLYKVIYNTPLEDRNDTRLI